MQNACSTIYAIGLLVLTQLIDGLSLYIHTDLWTHKVGATLNEIYL